MVAQQNGPPVTIDAAREDAQSYAAFGDPLDFTNPTTGYMGISVNPATGAKHYRISCTVKGFSPGSLEFTVTDADTGKETTTTAEKGKHLIIEFDPIGTDWRTFWFSSKAGWIFRSCSVREQS